MDFKSLSDDEIAVLAEEIPVMNVGKTVSDVLIDASVVSSKGESRRLIQNGGVSIDGVKITEDVLIDAVSLVKKGKNTFILVK
ncbi:MAG: hypothetical protein EOP04_32345 [Proteobacteria bacterium]|nr:MAG: hypothetical protein EOP04_32345 [Pseudomonadota bacterium]